MGETKNSLNVMKKNAPSSVANGDANKASNRSEDFERYRDKHRYKVTMFLLWIFSGQMIFIGLFYFILFFLGKTQQVDRDIYDTLNQTISLLFGPTAALVGTATGFYFGGRNTRTSERSSGQETGS